MSQPASRWTGFLKWRLTDRKAISILTEVAQQHSAHQICLLEPVQTEEQLTQRLAQTQCALLGRFPTWISFVLPSLDGTLIALAPEDWRTQFEKALRLNPLHVVAKHSSEDLRSLSWSPPIPADSMSVWKRRLDEEETFVPLPSVGVEWSQNEI